MADGKRSVIIGLGATGFSCARYFHARGIPFEVMDHAEAPPLADRLFAEIPGARLITGGLDEGRLLDAEQIVVSPGVPLALEEIRRSEAAGIPVTGDIDLFSRVAEQPFVAITGSNGKSTVTTLVGEMAAACGVRAGVGGNLGPPALDLLEGDYDLYVLEISSFQLETARCLGAEIAVLLNLSPDHLDRYPSAAAYYAAKARIFDGCHHAVIGAADIPDTDLSSAARVWMFGMASPSGEHAFGMIESSGEWYLARGDETLLPVRDMVLRGSHNYLNALAALAVGAAAGWPLAPALEVVKSFRGLPHRCERVAAIDGVTYINDSKATNVGATVTALESLGSESGGARIVLIAGGAHKAADYEALVDPVRRYVRCVVLIGEEAARIAESLDGIAAIEHAAALDDAVAVATARAREGDLVLLSPACSSVDMFGNFEERGEAFRRAVALRRPATGGAT